MQGGLLSAPALGLLLVSLIWGTTFVSVKTALRDATPFLFVGIRFGLAALAAIPLVRARGPALREALRRGIPLGIIMAGAYASQTIGLTVTSPARSAFVTGLNVALVPFWAFLLTGRRPGRLPVIALLITIPGLWLLTHPQGSSWNRGDSATLVCAVLYALYVVLIGRRQEHEDPGALLVSQLATTAACCFVVAGLVERPHLHPSPTLFGALALTAFLATTLTTWLQLRLQPRVGANRAAVIYATEPVFAAFFSWVVFREGLAPSAWAGGGMILAGMLLSELGAGRAVPERS